MNRTTVLFSRRMKKAVLGLMLSACMLTTSGMVVDMTSFAAEAKDSPKPVASETKKSEMPSIEEENVGCVRFSDCEHIKAAFALSDEESITARYGDKVYFYLEPDDGWGVSDIYLSVHRLENGHITDQSNSYKENISIKFNQDVTGVYYFEMPEYDNVWIDLEAIERDNDLSSIKKTKKSSNSLYYDYMVNHLNSDYVNPSANLELEYDDAVNFLTARYIMASDDGSGTYLAKTADDFSDDVDCIHQLRGLYDSNPLVFDVDKDSAYYVSFVNPMVSDKDIVVTDVLYAMNNNRGETIDGCFYDSETGIVYIPKKAMNQTDEDGNPYFNDVRVQFNCVKKAEDSSHTIQTNIKGYGEVSSLTGTGSVSYSDTRQTFLVDLGIPDDLKRSFVADDIKVSVNGISIPKENEDGTTRFYTYDDMRGILEVYMSPFTVRFLDIEIGADNLSLNDRGKSALSILADAFLPSSTAHAANIYNQWHNVGTEMFKGKIHLEYDDIKVGTNMDFKKNKKAMFDYKEDNKGKYTSYFNGSPSTYLDVIYHTKDVPSAMQKASNYADVSAGGSSVSAFSLKLKPNAQTIKRANGSPLLKINKLGFVTEKGWQKYQMHCAHATHPVNINTSNTKLQVLGICVDKGTYNSGGKEMNCIVNSYMLSGVFHNQSMMGTLMFGVEDDDEHHTAFLDIDKYLTVQHSNIEAMVKKAGDMTEELFDLVFEDELMLPVDDNPNYDLTACSVTLKGYKTEEDRTNAENCKLEYVLHLDDAGTAHLNNSQLRSDGEIIKYWSITETTYPRNGSSPYAWFVSNAGNYTSYSTGNYKAFDISEDAEKAIELFDTAASNSLQLQKTVDYSAFIKNNPNYNYNSTFTVEGPYYDASCSDAGEGTYWSKWTITTLGNTNGTVGVPSPSRLDNLELGYYRVTETARANGTVIAKNTEILDLTVPNSNPVSPTVHNYQNKVKRNPINILLRKLDKNKEYPVGDAKLSGIRYRISVYGTEADDSFLYSFEATTKEDNGIGVLNLNKDGGCVDMGSFQGKSVNDVYIGNVMNFPIGYVRIKEIDATNSGYQLANPQITSTSNEQKIINGDTLQAHILDDGNTSTIELNYLKNDAQTWGDTPLFGGIKIKKRDFDRLTSTNNLAGEENDNDRTQGDAKFEGIKFKIYNISQKAVYLEDNPKVMYPACTQSNLNEASVVANLTCDSKGECQTKTNLPYGTYLIKEDVSNMDTNDDMGYLSDANISAVIQIHPRNDSENHRMYSTDDLIKNNGITITSTLTEEQLKAHKEIFADKIKRGGVILQKLIQDHEDATAKHDDYTGKKRYDGNQPIPEGDGTLAGTEFAIYSISAEDVCIYNDEDGNSKTWKKSYTKSRLDNATWKLGSDGKYGYYDGNTKLEPCLTLTTNDKGIAKSLLHALPYGTYVVRESKAPTGARINTNWMEQFEIRKHEKYVDVCKSYSNEVTKTSTDTFTRDKTGFNPLINEPIRGNVMVEKDDKEYGKSEANGGKDHGNNQYGTHLEGIEFTIKNKSTYPVYVDTDDDGIGEEYMPGEDIYKVYTKWDTVRKKYVASTCPWDEAKQTFVENPSGYWEYRLPYGTYGIRETDTTDSYILEDTEEKTFVIREDKKLVTRYVKGSNTSFDEMIFYNSVVRGDFEFEKQIERKEDEMSTVFVVTNQTTGERHVIVTDRNGEYRTDKDWTRHEYHTNYNDVLLKQIDAGEPIDMDKIVNNYRQAVNGNKMTDADIQKELNEKGDGAFLERCGLWFSLGEDGSTSEPSVIRGVDYREHGALPYGYYTVREVRTTTNKKYDLIDWNVWIYNDNTENKNRVDCGTKENFSNPAGLKSVAKDLSTEKHIGMAAEKTVIEDTVTVSNVYAGREYVLIGKLYDATDDKYVTKEDNTDYTVEQTFTPGYHDSEDSEWDDEDDTLVSQDITQTFKFDARKFAGHKIVVYEMLYQVVDGHRELVAVHRDKNDEYQTVRYPSLSTLNLSDTTKDHDNPTTGKVTLTDTVTYTGLLPNKNYKLTGILMDKDAGDEAMDKNHNYIEATASFFADESDGTAILTYKFDAEGFAGKTLVSFVTLNQGGDDLALHANLNDEYQSIHFPDVHTTALDNVTGDHESLAENPVTIVDTVAYENLLPGKTYLLKGVLMNKKTGEKLLDAEGKEITSEVEFVPVDADGSIEVIFTFDGSLLEGETTVAFETLERDDIELTTHADIEDKDQSVRFPKIQTTATYGEDALNEGKAIQETKITDTIYYENLKPGEEYVVSGILMDKNTKTPVVSIEKADAETSSGSAVSGENVSKNPTGQTKEVTAEAKFVPEESSGYVEVVFTFDATDYAGHDTVVFETLYHNDFKVAVHEDYDDEGQTIHFPKIGTTLTDKNTKLHESTVAESITLVDTVAYKNLRTDKTYTVTGVLYDKKTGKPLSVDGKEVTATKEFMPDKPDGVVELEFTFNSSALRGSTVVAFEDLYRDDINVATHADINDEDQTVVFPDIKTFAKKTDTEAEKILYVNDKMSITDIVTYSNVIPGHRYEVTGTLMSKKQKKEVVVSGAAVSATAEFVPEKDTGDVELTFQFDATNYVDDDLVCFDDLSVIDDSNPDDKGDGIKTLLLSDKDWENKDETITIPRPEVHTNAVNNETKTKQMSFGEKATITDTVTYSKLNPGTSYSLTGTLMNKKTEEPIVDSAGKPITSSVTFVPEQPDGTVDMTFTLDTRQLASESIVVFENLYLNNVEIASHADIKDKDQTTYVMSVHTKAAAADKRSKVVDVSKKAKIVDTVSYKNLVAGEKYIVTGKLMNKATNHAIQKDGVDYTVSKEFTPEKRSGEVDITFTVDTTSLKNATLVVFEDVTTVNGTLVGQHHDINDENQSVVIRTTTKVQTGVRNHAGLIALLITAMAGILGAAFLYLKRRRRVMFVKSARRK